MDGPVENNGKTTKKQGFQRGKSGNPGGRPKKTQAQKDALESIRQLAPNAAQTLRDMLENPDVPANVRVKAVEIILDRTYGKPDMAVKVDTPKAAALDDIRQELKKLRDKP